jgi:CMP-N-acetylneuraminic acid synthetase|tara:strand:- start:5020 stop:5739 length:720 start_codon:yes stop_codon:yes gene_type:complete
MNILITICARGGSKGLPGKNYKELNGKPLVAYSGEQAVKLAEILGADIAISTDSATIKNCISHLNGIDLEYLRPEVLSGSSVSKVLTIKALKEWKEKKENKEYDVVIDLDVVAPLRTIDELVDCFNKLNSNEEALNIFSVSEAKKNPYFNMIEMNGDFGHIPCGAGEVISRQTAPEVYELNGSFYMYRKSFFDQGLTTPYAKKTMVYKVEHHCFDIDDPIDFDWLEFLMNRGDLNDILE